MRRLIAKCLGHGAVLTLHVIMREIELRLARLVGRDLCAALAETLRIWFGTKGVGWDNLIYGILLVLFIIFLPKGILGSALERLSLRRRPVAAPTRPAVPAGPER